jgi:hypothetical protein
LNFLVPSGRRFGIQAHFYAEPLAQEYARLERLRGIAIEPLGDLPAVERVLPVSLGAERNS